MNDTENADLEVIRTCASAARHAYIEDMETKLNTFEKRLLNKNFKVYWASTEADLVAMTLNLLPGKLYNNICFDLPTIPEGFNTSRITKVSINQVENDTQSASILFTQADYGIVETGTLALYDRKSKNCLHKVPNIFLLLDISKLVNKASELETLLYLRSYYQSQTFLPQDVKLLNAPFMRMCDRLDENGEKITQEPVEITVFLYDNGVTQILQDATLRSALYCINCGQCKTVCPMYEFDKEFTPIGLVRANCFEAHRATGELQKRSLLCGNCEQACPVQVPFTDLIIKELEISKTSKKGLLDLSSTFKKRKKLNKKNGAFAYHLFIRKLYGKNKMLFNYFKKQRETFFNLIRSQQSEDE